MGCHTLYRGTTPTIILKAQGIDFSSANTWPVVVVTLKAGAQSIDVERDQLTIAKNDDGSTVSMQLTQEQTLGFDVMRPVFVQLRAKDADGHAIASEVASVTVADILKDGEI